MDWQAQVLIVAVLFVGLFEAAAAWRRQQERDAAQRETRDRLRALDERDRRRG